MPSRSQSDIRGPYFPVAKEAIFLLALGVLFTHELDAVANHEWRVMPLLDRLPEQTGLAVFIALHVPLFALLAGIVASRDSQIRTLARLLICSFLLIHAGLHYWFSNAPDYEFGSVLSGILIYGGAMLGGMYLLLHVLIDR